MKLDCEFIMTPRILFSDKRLTRTDIDLLSLIISLALNNNYCYANNKYLADYINTSKRTITDSLSKLKKAEYITIKYDKDTRKVYLNPDKIPLKTAPEIAEICGDGIENHSYHNINNKNKDKDKEDNKILKNLKIERIIPELLRKKNTIDSNEEEQVHTIDEVLEWFD